MSRALARRLARAHATVADGRTRAVLALGSNQGDRVGLFRDAFAKLRRDLGFELHAHSSLYETAPAYVEDQGKFLNAACVGSFPDDVARDPLALLDGLKAIEAALGRGLRDAAVRTEADGFGTSYSTGKARIRATD